MFHEFRAQLTVIIKASGPPAIIIQKPEIMMKVKMPRITQFFHLQLINVFISHRRRFSSPSKSSVISTSMPTFSDSNRQMKLNTAYRDRISVMQLIEFSVVIECPRDADAIFGVNKEKLAQQRNLFDVYFVKFAIANCANYRALKVEIRFSANYFDRILILKNTHLGGRPLSAESSTSGVLSVPCGRFFAISSASFSSGSFSSSESS